MCGARRSTRGEPWSGSRRDESSDRAMKYLDPPAAPLVREACVSDRPLVPPLLCFFGSLFGHALDVAKHARTSQVRKYPGPESNHCQRSHSSEQNGGNRTEPLRRQSGLELPDVIGGYAENHICPQHN